jgi:hypothetical protein
VEVLLDIDRVVAADAAKTATDTRIAAIDAALTVT